MSDQQPPDGTARPAVGADPSDLEAIEAERARRLAPESRPPGAEVDNTGDNAPDLSAVDPSADLSPEEAAAIDGTGGTSDPSAGFREIRPSEEEVAEIESERARRLAPENRPPGAEVDNTRG